MWGPADRALWDHWDPLSLRYSVLGTPHTLRCANVSAIRLDMAGPFSEQNTADSALVFKATSAEELPLVLELNHGSLYR